LAVAYLSNTRSLSKSQVTANDPIEKIGKYLPIPPVMASGWTPSPSRSKWEQQKGSIAPDADSNDRSCKFLPLQNLD